MNTQPQAVRLYEFLEEGNDLLARARRCLENAPYEGARKLAERIPTRVLSDEDKIKVVFAGQYSAGKSSIVKVLTGRDDIVIGAGITTDKTNAYEWGDIIIIDTPGIHTELRPDHDKITYKAIEEADLLIFVVTNELFDSHIAEHFRKLAIEHDKGHEMMLVVNKMGRCAQGNTQEVQNIIREDLRKVLEPFTPEELRLTFIDANYALESKVERDSEIAGILRRKSGFDRFIEEINRFVDEKGLSSRCTTALYTLNQILHEALNSESTGDKDLDASRELLLKKRLAILRTKNMILQSAKDETNEVTSQIRQEGYELANEIGFVDQEVFKQKLRDAQNRVERLCDQLENSLKTIISEYMKELDDHFTEIINSELARELLSRLNRQDDEITISPGKGKVLRKMPPIFHKTGDFIIQKSLKGGVEGITKLSSYSGTEIHELVKSVGKFFGKSFKPWEAVKWTRFVARAGRILAWGSVIFSFGLTIKDAIDASERTEKLRKCRLDIISAFNDVASNIERQSLERVQLFLSKTIYPELDSIDSQLEEVKNLQQIHSDFYRRVDDLINETKGLIRKLHTVAKKQSKSSFDVAN